MHKGNYTSLKDPETRRKSILARTASPARCAVMTVAGDAGADARKSTLRGRKRKRNRVRKSKSTGESSRHHN